MNDPSSDDAFVDRISQPLRAVERVDPEFDARVLASIQAVSRMPSTAPAAPRRSWWRRARPVHLTPLAMLSAAAGLGFALVATVAAARRADGPVAVAATPDTVHVVRFVYVDPGARNVSLAGSFTQWEKQPMTMQPAGVPGVWSVEVSLPPGRHEYAFVVAGATGERWSADPFTIVSRDEFGTPTSFLSLGGFSRS